MSSVRESGTEHVVSGTGSSWEGARFHYLYVTNYITSMWRTCLGDVSPVTSWLPCLLGILQLAN